MIEVLVVLAITAIVVTMSFAYMIGSRPAAQMNRAELQLSSDLGLSRDLAYNEESPVRVIFDLSTEQYWTEIQDTSDGTWSTATVAKDFPEGVSITSVSFTNNTVNFTPRGTLVVGGSITITNSRGDSTVLNGVIPTGRFPVLGGALR